MSDLATVRNRILSDLNRTSANDLTSNAETEIRTAIAFYERRRFWFLEGRSTTETTTGQEYYELPEDFRDEDSLTITVNQYTYPLVKRTFDYIENTYVDTSPGIPSEYAIYDQQIRLYPIPSGQYPLVLSYYQQLSALTNGTDTNAWMVEGEGLIRARAEWVLFARKLRDYDAAQACKALEREELEQHEKLTNARLLTGHTKRRYSYGP